MPNSQHGPHSPEDFEQRYSAAEKLWSGHPNDALVRVTGDLPPGSALDIGCGEGADLAYLTSRGWQATGFDPSATAVARAREVAPRAQITVSRFEDYPTHATFDLVACSYGVLERSRESVEKLCALCRTGGTLFVVHHRMQAPTDRLMPEWLAKNLGPGFVDVQLGTHNRDITGGAGSHHHEDVILTARRV